MIRKNTARRTIKLKADIEYQVVWSETAAQWEIHRNGVKTNASRRKKQSAIDRAIIAVLSELISPEARAVVTSLKEGTIQIEWAGRSPPGHMPPSSNCCRQSII
jgi:hypothetical protein